MALGSSSSLIAGQSHKLAAKSCLPDIVMIEGYTVLAIVPARSGSKGILDKNMARIAGLSLIARAGKTLSQIPWIDRRVISTDSQRYADEARAHGLDAPFLRPEELSTDNASALDTIVHALKKCEELDARAYDLVIVAEPTSPLRVPADIDSTVRVLLGAGADTALTVNGIDTKSHPLKLFQIVDGKLNFYNELGRSVTNRQSLEHLYSRNGLCYCFRRETLLNKRALITDNTVPVLIERHVANIDEPIDLLWAQFLLERTEDPQLQPLEI
jgi:CMP-N-acetylneuraminic acid synthetase